MHETDYHVTGVVLAGGQSRRFGRDKALASFEQTTLIGHAVALLRAASPDILVVTCPEHDYLGLDARIIHDIYPNCGPLGGIYTACRYAKTAFLLVLSCDMPLLSPRAIFHLLHSHRKQESICIYQQKQQLQPFPGIYATTLQARMKDAVKRGQLSMHEFIREVTDVRTVTPTGIEAELTNVNTEHQLMSLQRRNRHSQKDNDHEKETSYSSSTP